MQHDAEAWLEGAYPELFSRWREAYLKPCPSQQDQTSSDLCKICHLRYLKQRRLLCFVRIENLTYFCIDFACDTLDTDLARYLSNQISV
jgi:hypothetical protein